MRTSCSHEARPYRGKDELNNYTGRISAVQIINRDSCFFVIDRLYKFSRMVFFAEGVNFKQAMQLFRSNKPAIVETEVIFGDLMNVISLEEYQGDCE